MMLNVFLYLNKEEKWKQTTGQDEDENMKMQELSIYRKSL